MRFWIAHAGLAASLALVGMAAASAEPPREAHAQSPDLVFAGYAIVDREQLFVLVDPEAKRCSPWMRLGQEWRGFTVRAFDRDTEQLTLRTGTLDRVLALPMATIRPALVLPGLIKGSYTPVNGRILYSTDAQLKLGNGFVISSPTGRMSSDEKQSVVTGELVIETNGSTIRADEATVDTTQNRIIARNMKISMRPAASPSPGAESSPSP